MKKDSNRKSWYQFILLLLRILRYLETRHCTCWTCPEGFFEHCMGIYVSIRVAWFVPQTTSTCHKSWVSFTERCQNIVMGCRCDETMWRTDVLEIGCEIFRTWSCLTLCSMRSFLSCMMSSTGNLIYQNALQLLFMVASRINLAHGFCNLKSHFRCSKEQFPHTVQQYSLSLRGHYKSFSYIQWISGFLLSQRGIF